LNLKNFSQRQAFLLEGALATARRIVPEFYAAESDVKKALAFPEMST